MCLALLEEENIWTQTCIDGRREETQGEDGYLQAKESGLGQILSSETSEGTNLILDF